MDQVAIAPPPPAASPAPASIGRPAPPQGGAAIIAAYAITIFTSAFLLFQVQPLISKFILPWFGGSPAVWTAAMLLMLLGNVAMLYVPGLPIWLGLAIAFAARNSAVYFTKWYPQYRKAKYGKIEHGAPPAHALPKTN